MTFNPRITDIEFKVIVLISTVREKACEATGMDNRGD